MSPTPLRTFNGTLVRVDPLARSVSVRCVAGTLTLTVPPDASVRLQGEPVRLRMLQPGDPVAVEIYDGPTGPAAASVSVPG